ncbi:Xaa-Pro peptidase family protein [Aquibacillus koreensis]|uniref:Xaa-Pro peptidase family protein n=2 Tax=Aquibacillus koreensis TaxID=279446 RepID=A0A9X3WGD0_9BACI|nr:Xaa-Pro peptidase family protein [Aquibacillus koreensis]
MANENVDAVFITSKANVYYISNYYTDPHERLVAVYITKSGDTTLIVPAMEKADALASGWKGDILTYSDSENPWELFAQHVNNHPPLSIGIEKNHMTVERQEALQGILPSCRFKNINELLASLRLLKDQSEYKLLKQAAQLADLGVKTGIESIEAGKGELEIVAQIEYILKQQGIRDMSFSTMVLSGQKTASPHGTPSLDQINSGDLVLFDLGVVFEGYCSDITRTVAYQSISQKQEDIYNTVLTAQQKAIDAVKSDTDIGLLNRIARSHIKEAGYGNYFTHRLGHGIGIDVHEYPSLNSNNTLKIQKGMSFTIEPGIYVPHIGGVRIEDQVFVTKEGPELLTKYPKELQIIK